MKKKLQALLQKRKALLGDIDAILTAAEASTEKRETPQQTEQRKAKEAELANLDADIGVTEALVVARERQEQLEKNHPVEEPDVRSRPPVADVHTGLSAQELKDLQGYSFVRAFRNALEQRSQDGIEGEMHKTAEAEYREAGVQRQNGNLLVPQLVMRSAGCIGSMERRDVTATGQTSAPGDQGGLTIQTTVGSLIDRLRNALVMNQMGVTMLGGLQGNIDFPKIIADDQAVEKAENATSAESSPTFSKISLTPRRLPVHAELSRQLLMQSTADVEAWVRRDLAFQIAQVMDNRSINGTGSSQPYGILNTVGIGAVVIGTNGGAPTWDTVVDLETAVAALNADFGALGYLTNTKVRGKLKKTLVTSSTQAQFIWDRQSPSTPLNEYKVGVTNLVASNLTKNAGTNLSSLLFGNFNDALMGQWGGLEFLINPYSKDTEGLIRINCWTFYDFIVRRVESFAACKEIVTT